MPLRLLRPALRTSERWQRSSYFHRCLYVSLLSLVDDYGRYDANPTLLASECFPYGDENGMPMTPLIIDGGLRGLAAAVLISVYESGGKWYLQFERWKERARSESKFPALKDPSSKPVYVSTLPKIETQSENKSVEIEHFAKVASAKDLDENSPVLQTNAVNCDHLRAPKPKPTPKPACTPMPALARISNESVPEIVPEIPSVEEVIRYGLATAGVPESYSRDYHAKRSEKHEWTVKAPGGEKVIQWKSQIVRYWNSDRHRWRPATQTEQVKNWNPY